MSDAILTIVLIGALFIGLPVLILVLRDRGSLPGTLLLRFLGFLAVGVGLALLGWAAYGLFDPVVRARAGVKTFFQFAVPVAMVWVGWKWLTTEGPGIESTPMDFQCEELRASVGKARATLPWFLEQVDKNVDGAFVKFALKTPNDLTEHVWAYVHGFQDGAFNVSIANDPIDREQDVSGRRRVPLEEVEDWQIMHPDGRIKGAYSLIALFEHREATGRRLSKRMRKQKAQLIDAGEAKDS